jgi:hypothetical protein
LARHLSRRRCRVAGGAVVVAALIYTRKGNARGAWQRCALVKRAH